MKIKKSVYVSYNQTSSLYFYTIKSLNENGTFDVRIKNAVELGQLRSKASKEVISEKLKQKLKNVTLMLVLVGEKSAEINQFVWWEVQAALDAGIPIVAVNINGHKDVDSDHCPSILLNNLTLHIPFRSTVIEWSICNWPKLSDELKKAGTSEAMSMKADTLAKLIKS